MSDQELIQRILSNSTDYYNVLQIDRDASLSAIRRSYYKLSLRLHPDKNPDNSEAVKQAFQIVSRSYEVLRDPTTRSIYNSLGAKGLQSFESGGVAQSAREFFFSIVRAMLFGLVRHTARRMGATSFLQHIYLSLFNPVSEKKEFCICFTKEWVHFRRHVAKCFAGVLAFFLILLSIEPIYGVFYGAGSSNQPSEALAAKDPSFYLPKDSQNAHNLSKPLLIYASCLLEADPRAFLACHERLLALERSSGKAERPPGKWVSERYAGPEEVKRAAFLTSLRTECEREELLQWASRERFEQTATIRAKVPLLRVKNQNFLPKRKYPEKRWHSRFRESFTVAKPEELYQPSSFCEQLWQRPLTGVV